MPTQIAKLKAHSEHLLDGFLGLREKWALLRPMLRDPQLLAGYSRGYRARGFGALRRTLALACATDIANLAQDKFAETPSIYKIQQVLSDPHVRVQLRREYSHWVIDPLDPDDTDPDVRAQIKRLMQRKSQERAAEFDAKYMQFAAGWQAFSTSPVLILFAAVRDKVAAHSELHFVGDRYAPVTLGTLGMKAAHFDEALAAMLPLVELVQNLTRSAGFAWDSLEQQLDKTPFEFWQGAAR